MSPPQKYGLRVAIMLGWLLLVGWSSAESQSFQFLPEVDVHYRVHPDVRLSFQVKETREAGSRTQFEIGPTVDFFLKPIASLVDLSTFDLDVKSRALQLSASYFVVPAADKPLTERIALAATPRFPFFAKILITDRNRVDLDWSGGQFSWRYRNRATLERRLTIKAYHPAPYVSAEFYYESQYEKWTTTALRTGCLFPIHRQIDLDFYYEHQNITNESPNKRLNQVGMTLGFYLGE